MKAIEKQKARILRKKEGMSINKIADKLGVSKGSVSVWVRDIKLSDKQYNELNYAKTKNSKLKGGHEKWARKCREKRLQHQADGREMVSFLKNDKNFLGGFILGMFISEGDKSKNVVGFSNTDPILIKLFFNQIEVDSNQSYSMV